MKIALKLAYLGDAYYGFQRQPDLVTVDSEVRKALLKIGVINGDFCYAGRTDRGVSALGQVIDFWIDEDKAYLARPRCVNGRLPRDIWTWAWAVAPIGFSARWNALWREYRYLLWHPGLDLQIMRECAELLKGEHDFRNFSSAKVDTVKTVTKLEILEQNGLFVLDIRANGFLWNMVRKIVGALEKVGAGERSEKWFSDLLRPELNHGAPTAPAEGLMLMDVGYEGLEWQVDDYSRQRAATALAATVQKRMAMAQVARAMQEAMEQ
ncbi:MAG TPA: tRNA pseudouridine(38-40) synthase TruA [Methanotrichaceae archaeon]|nr:tRNA pseudouridine(38-40) synthase TruA [Methanotrichaceae archaeon]